MYTYRIAAIPGDGIGGEVIGAGLEALDALAARSGGGQLIAGRAGGSGIWISIGPPPGTPAESTCRHADGRPAMVIGGAGFAGLGDGR